MSRFSVHPGGPATAANPGFFVDAYKTLPKAIFLMLIGLFIASIQGNAQIIDEILNSPTRVPTGNSQNSGLPGANLALPAQMPVLKCPSPITVNCTTGTSPSVTGTPIFSNFCAGASVQYTDEIVAANCPKIISRNWTVTDICGNTRSCAQLITINDNTPPALNMPAITSADVSCEMIDLAAAIAFSQGIPNTGFLQSAAALFQQLNLIPTGSTDACSPSSWSETGIEVITGPCALELTLICYFTATDACGNQSPTLSTSITIVDNEAPEIEAQPDFQIASCDPVPDPVKPIIKDKCDPEPFYSFVEIVIAGSCPYTYSIQRIWIATDACGNTASDTLVIDVIDNIAPTLINTPVDAVANCESIPKPPLVLSKDNCDPSPTLTYLEEIIPGSCPNNYTLIRIWKSEDACGNSTQHIQTITVVDNIGPQLLVPADTVFNCQIGNLTAATATDNCNEVVETSFQDIPTLDELGFGQIERVWTATDACGNMRSQTQLISITDNTPPVVNCTDRTVYLGSNGMATISAADFQSSISDNCGIASVSLSKTVFNCTNLGINTVAITVVDFGGNSTTCTSEINVMDATAPTAVCKNVQVFLNSNGVASVNAGQLNAGSFDNCGIAQLFISGGKSSYTCGDELTNFTVALTVVDLAGNSSVCYSNVYVGLTSDSDGDNVSNTCDECFGNDASGDSDNDGICNNIDLCPFYPDLIDGDFCTDINGNEGILEDCECNLGPQLVCTSPAACNFWNPANFPQLSAGIDYIISPEICIEPFSCFICVGSDGNGNGSLQIEPSADTNNNEICDTEEPAGCTSPSACNYNPFAAIDNGSCIEPSLNCILCISGFPFFVFIDSDGDGICNAQEIPGCTNPWACNYNPLATQNNGTCSFAEAGCSLCAGGQSVPIDNDQDGVPDCEEIFGCTNPLACNFNPDASENNGSCLIPQPNCSACLNVLGQWLLIPIDSDNDGICNANEVSGCTVATACNFNPLATNNNNSCIIPIPNCTACSANGLSLVFLDNDLDGICNAQEIPGCTNPTACNYNPLATDNNGSCLIPVAGCTVCVGNFLVLQDADNDGICNSSEIPGCTNPLAANFNSTATEDNGSCIFQLPGCTDPNASNYNPLATVGNGTCVYLLAGCTDPAANNYNSDAVVDNGSCNYLSCPIARTLPFCARFNAGNLGGFSQTPSPTDDFDWSLHTGPTPSEETGPDAGFGGTGGYLYLEASEPNNPIKRAVIRTPCLDLGANPHPAISFAYHMYGANVGKLFVEITTDGSIWDVLWMKQGNQGNQWLVQELSLQAYAGQFVRIRFRGITSQGWKGDIAIDEICVGDNPQVAAIQLEDDVVLDESHENISRSDEEKSQIDEGNARDTKPEMLIYPNPAGNVNQVAVNVHNIPETEETIQLNVFDLTGRSVLQRFYGKGAAVGGHLQIRNLDAAFANGTYIVSVSGQGFVLTQKMVLSE